MESPTVTEGIWCTRLHPARRASGARALGAFKSGRDPRAQLVSLRAEYHVQRGHARHRLGDPPTERLLWKPGT